MNRLGGIPQSNIMEWRGRRAPDVVIARLIAVHDLLASESDISPRNLKIGPALGGLVELLLRSYEPAEAAAILDHTLVRGLRLALLDRLSEAESALEFFWSQRFLGRNALRLVDLEEFLYWRHYERLLATELQTLARTRWRLQTQKHGAIVFVGSGALPLSAIVLHMLTGEPVVCLDSDAATSDCAGQILAKLRLSSVTAVHADGATFDYRDASAVFIASLVTKKTCVARRIAETSEDAIVAVRTVEGLRTLLYAPADIAALKAEGLCLAGQTKPDAETINNTLFFNICPLKTASPTEFDCSPCGVPL